MSDLNKDKIIITAALTGAVTPKSLNSAIPCTPKEIAEDAYHCWKVGAAVVHLHMRDKQMRGVMDVDLFKETIEQIRAYKDCDVIINCTSSGTWDQVPGNIRQQHFKEIPEIEMGSLDIGSFNWADGKIFDNDPKFLKELTQTYLDYNVRPELEIFDHGMITNAEHYVKLRLLQKPLYVQLVMGVLGASPATADALAYLVRNLPEGTIWSAFGIGKAHLPIMYAALAFGANGLRVGLEDNVWYTKGVHATNVSLVERAVRVVKEFGKQPATSAEARKILGINPFSL